MKVDYEMFPEIPQGCQLNLNKKTNVYQVFREERITDPNTGTRKTRRTTIGQIKDGVFTYSKLWLALHDRELLQKKLLESNQLSEQTQKHSAHVKEKIETALKKGGCEQRDERRIVYPLEPIACAALMSSLTGSSDCSQIAQYLNDHRHFFEQIHDDLPKEPLTHDVVYKAFLKVDAAHFDSFYDNLLSSLVSRHIDGRRIISADGQAVRVTSKNTNSRQNDCYMLMNFYDSSRRICLKQRLIAKKTNEITVGPQMLESLDITNAIITADAMSCQVNFVSAVRNKGADYCISLKGNQDKSWEEVRLLFNSTNPDQILHSETQWDSVHGRIEKRCIDVIRGALLSKPIREKWDGLEEGSIVQITSYRDIKKTGETTTEVRYYISSLPATPNSVTSLETVIRSHWAVENNLHWILDVNFGQDRIQASNEDYITNRVALNKLALAMLENYRFWLWNLGLEKDVLSIKAIRQRCRNPEKAMECIACAQGFYDL